MQKHPAMTHQENLKILKCYILFILIVQLASLTGISFAQIQLNPSEAHKHNLTGMEHLSKKNYADAYHFFQLAIQHNPSIKYYYNNIAVACMNLRKYEEALLHLNKAIEIDPMYARALSNKAICHFRLSQYRLAFAYYRKARNADSAYTGNRFTQPKIIREMEQIQKSRPHDAELRQIIDRVRKLEKMP